MRSAIRYLLKNKWVRACFALAVISGLMLVAKAWHDTMRDPVVERLVVESENLPPSSAPITIAVVADIHMDHLIMSPERVERIVAQVNELEPDLIALLGDYVTVGRDGSQPFTPQEVIAPLSKLSAPLGVVLVPGNHDHWYGWSDLRRELTRHPHITVLENSAVQFGPLAVAGLDDEFTGNHDIEATTKTMAPLTGAQIWLSHTPDTFPSIPVSADLVLAGHTHCGQVAYPWGTPVMSMSAYGDAYVCGVTQQHGKVLLTSAGLGTSLAPVRLFTQPEIWLVEVRASDP